MSELQQFILDFIGDRERHTFEIMVAAQRRGLAKTDNQVRAAIIDLQKDGRLICLIDGYWRLTDMKARVVTPELPAKTDKYPDHDWSGWD